MADVLKPVAPIVEVAGKTVVHVLGGVDFLVKEVTKDRSSSAGATCRDVFGRIQQGPDKPAEKIKSIQTHVLRHEDKVTDSSK